MRMARRRVSFKEKAKKLVRISQLLFDADPWPDAETGRFARDLILVRNIIVHAGGWPTDEHANTIETPGVIVRVHNLSWKSRSTTLSSAGFSRLLQWPGCT